MKRSLILLLTAVICAVSFTIPAAAEVTDSLTLNSEEKAQLNVSSGATVVKLFCGSFMSDFAEQKDIADIVEKSETMYLIKSGFGGIVYKQYYNGEIVQLDPSTGIPDWSGFYKYATSSRSVLGLSVKVNAIYCLNGEPSHDGVYIYYDTNKGGYVLFKEYLSSDKTYLFPVSDFYEFSAAVENDRILHKDSDGGGTEITELFDVQKYLYNPFRRLLPAVIVCAVLVAAGGILLSRRKKAKKG